MRTVTAFATTAGACAFVAVAITTPASAKPGIHLNGPSLDGQQVALPAGTADQELAFGDPGITINGPALDGQRLTLPGRPRDPSEVANEEPGIDFNGATLDGRKIALPYLPVRARH